MSSEESQESKSNGQVANGGQEKHDLEKDLNQFHNGLGTESPQQVSEDEDATEDEEEEREETVSDEYDEDEDDEDEDDEEPTLKYERIGGSVQDLLKKDTASALSVTNRLIAMGTHAGIVHILDLEGKRVKSYKRHLASIIDISLDASGEFVATASMDGQVVIQSLSATESYVFDMKRPMRSVAMEPNFAKTSTRAFVCGGLAGNLVLREKGWLGHKDTILHSGEGPIWMVRWRDRLIAWANDLGVKIYDTVSQTRITFIDRPENSPRADLFKCTLLWQDDSTLLIAWADFIKVARIRARPKTNAANTANQPPLLVEITAVFQLDCMIAGIAPHPTPHASMPPGSGTTAPSLTSLLVLAYSPPDTYDGELTDDRSKQARKAAERPELRLISRGGEELAADALSITDFHLWSCNDYVLAEVGGVESEEKDRCYVVLSPRDVVLAKPRDKRDHVEWLVERQRYEEALEQLEMIEEGEEKVPEGALSAAEIGHKYIQHLIDQDDYEKAAKLCPKVCGQNVDRWETWIFVFAEARHLQAVMPFVPTDSPRLGHLVYEMMLAHLLAHDRPALLDAIKAWPKDIYDLAAVIFAVNGELERAASTSTLQSTSSEAVILMECLAELYVANRQPGKALPFYLRLRRPNVFELIRENNLFPDVQDQVLLLVQFDDELKKKRAKEGLPMYDARNDAIQLLVDHIHSIPIGRVVSQLQNEEKYLFLYLDALFAKDPNLASPFADIQVKLFAKFAQTRLIDFLRSSGYYSLEKAYKVCSEADLVPEMVFLLGRMGNNKQALTLIIERLGDVNRAIDFAKEQADDDLWEDLLRYSETRPDFIRGLLENVGAEIDPIRLIRRIKIGLEIPGLKEALIKILQDFHLQISLLEGCQTILHGDGTDLSRKLQRDQTSGFFLTAKAKCLLCAEGLLQAPQGPVLMYLCRHVVHARCVKGGDMIPSQPDPVLRLGMLAGFDNMGLGDKIAFTSTVRAHVERGCPVCRRKSEGRLDPV